MSKYTIQWMKIKNFKVFDAFEINFNDSKLVSFGGANGYGKTTIFDAIELGMTGNINRIKSVDSSGSLDNIVAKDQTQLVEIEIKLINAERNILYIKRVLREVYRTKQQNKTMNFENLWKLVLIEERNEREIQQSELEVLLGEPKLYKFYNNFFYVQQEDTAHFLIHNEKIRLEKISELFNLDKEEREYENIVKIKEKTNTIKNNLDVYIQALQPRITTIEAVSNIRYDRLLPWKEINDEWDKEDLQFTDSNTRDNYLKEVRKIKDLFSNKEDFFKYFEYKTFLSDKNTLKVLLGKDFFEQYEKIKDSYEEKVKLLKIIEDLDDEDNLFAKEIDFEPLREKINFNFNSFDMLVDETSLRRDNVNLSDQVISEIIDLRSSLIASFSESSLDKEECPLCGYDWQSNPNYAEYKLVNALNTKKEYLESLVEGETRQYHDKKEELDGEIEKLIKLIEVYLENESFNISESMYEYICGYKDEVNKANSLLQYLTLYEIEFNDLQFTELSLEVSDELINSRIVNLIERLNQKVTFDSTFLELLESSSFFNIYTNHFNNSKIKINALTNVIINNKIQFVEYSYYNFNQSLQNQVSEIEEKIRNLDTLITNKLIPLENIYKAEIKKHREKMIKDIELPFYIYTGKILHSIRNNRIGGIFIKDPVQSEGLQNIRFVSDYSSDHDVINTVSSGQLAGIIIALTLTLNKVYSNGFNSIMIDDPVQSMDDINMISLIELFRNEFNDHQIFVSTHEDEIEKYILYKFMKYKLPVTRVDVMNKNVLYKEGEV